MYAVHHGQEGVPLTRIKFDYLDYKDALAEAKLLARICSDHLIFVIDEDMDIALYSRFPGGQTPRHN